jgi:uncharacterized delta-60 repeat protein
MRKLQLLGIAATTLVLVFTGGLSAAAGDLDPTFDGDGKVITDFGGSELAGGVAVQTDGKIVAVGTTQDPVTYATDFALARYNANGSLDPAFGSGGRVRTDFGGTDDRGFAVAIQADGKIVVAGWAFVPNLTYYTDVALARYNPDGSLDSSFGSGGKVVTNLQRTDFARGLAIQPDGKIVAVGGTRTAPTGFVYDFAVVRYNSDGSLDTTFGGSGYVVTPFSSSHDVAEGVVIQADGKIVAAGVADAGAPETARHALARYNPDGSLDGSFDGDGKVEGAPRTWASTIALQRDGKLVVATGDVSRYNVNGSRDATFGSNGTVDLEEQVVANVVLVQSNRTLVVAGALYDAQDVDFLVTRLNSDGAVDVTFGEKGRVHTDFGTDSYDEVNAAVLQSDGRVVVGGNTRPTSANVPVDFALARYLNPAPCKVPNVRGKKLALAKASIRRARCSVGKITRKRSRPVKKGRVLSQRPKAGTTAPSGTKVTLVVGKGRRR